MSQDEAYERAKQRVADLRQFCIHAAMFVAVNIGLFLIDILDSGDDYWSYWPLLGWGLGLAIHGIRVFATGSPLGSDWEKRKIKQLMDKDRKDQ